MMMDVRNSRILWTIPFLLILGVLCPCASGMVIYVDADATGANTGSSWPDAFDDLSEALWAASAGDEVRVAAGTYDDWYCWLGRGVTAKGGYAGAGQPDPDSRDVQAYETTVRGRIQVDGEILDGFTITSRFIEEEGGGLSIEGGSPTILNCTLIDNEATYGGGAYIIDAEPTFIDCVFTDNTAERDGGAVYITYTDWWWDVCPKFVNCTFDGNIAENGHGGAMYIEGSSWGPPHGIETARLINCRFLRNANFKDSETDFDRSGAIYNSLSSPSLDNCVLNDDMMNVSGSQPEMSNCTLCWCDIWGDPNDQDVYTSYPKMGNCIVWYGCVYDVWSGSRNLVMPKDYYTREDRVPGPLFVDPKGPDDIEGTADDDYRLLPGSPCIDAGRNVSVGRDWADLDGDGDTDERIPFDIAGNPRFADDPSTADSGESGAPNLLDYGVIVDMGAYEYQPPTGVDVASLSVTITPQEALDAGAQWRIDQGPWSSSATAAGITPGLHTVTFTHLAEWVEPEPILVRLVRGCPGPTVTAEYHVIGDYPIGEIPPQAVVHGQTLRFKVSSDELAPGATIDVVATPEPSGAMTYEPDIRLFSFTPASEDRGPFVATFVAASGAVTDEQSVTIWAAQDTPPEADVFGPDPSVTTTDRDYINVETQYGNAPEWLNHVQHWNEQRKQGVRTVTITGKAIAFQKGHENGLYDAFSSQEGAPVADIKRMNVYGETVVIGGPLWLPQTELVVHAKELRFVDPPGASWRSMAGALTYGVDHPQEQPQPTPPGNPPQRGARGADGLDGGNVTLHVESYDHGGEPSRFWLNGTAGQLGEEGYDGVDGNPKDHSFLGWTIDGADYYHPWPGHVTKARFKYWVTSQFPHFSDTDTDAWDAYEWRPGDGTDARPDGRPGDGGDGGDLSASLPLILDLEGDTAGGGGTSPWPHWRDRPGGAAGAPSPAYYICYNTSNQWQILGEHRSQPGKDGPREFGDSGANGALLPVGNPLSWLHPEALQAILAEAKDAYRFEDISHATNVLEEYTQLLDVYRAQPWWAEAPEEWRLDFADAYAEMVSLLHRIESNLDYFGNPPGWVPMLSFEVTKTAFDREIEHAIRVLYLCYWLDKRVSTIQEKVDALTYARAKLVEQTEQFKSDYADVVGSIPEMERESRALAGRIESLQDQLQQLEDRLIESARITVEVRHRVPAWKKAARGLAVICNASPVGQPQLAAVGSIATLLADYNPDDPIASIKQGGNLAQSVLNAKTSESAVAWLEKLDEIPLSELREQPGKVMVLAKALNELYGPMGKAVVGFTKQLKDAQIPEGELNDEISRLKAANPEFGRLADEVLDLMEEKKLFARKLAEATQQVSTLSEGIMHNLLAMDAMNQDIASGTLVLGGRTKTYLDGMERRARERLMKYHYYMAKAYEYRMLESYPDRLDLDRLFREFIAIAEEASASPEGPAYELDSTKYLSLQDLYFEQVSSLAQRVVDDCVDNEQELGPALQPMDLTPEEIRLLNAGQAATINLVERGLIHPNRECIRIADLRVLHVDVTTPAGALPSPPCQIEIKMEYAGISQLQECQAGAIYQFRHYSNRTKRPKTWRTDYFVLEDRSEPIGLSDYSKSLVRAILPELGAADLELYARPSAWADIRITAIQNSSVPLEINSVELELEYDYFPNESSDLKKLDVLVSPRGVSPYVIVEPTDRNARQDGRGSFRRIHQQGQSVRVQAPQQYGTWTFSGWTDRFGQPLGLDPTNAVLDLKLDDHRTAHAHYVSDIVLISGHLRTRQGVGLVAATVSAVGDGESYSAVTDDEGYYSLIVPRAWSGVVTPAKTGYTFDPPGTEYVALTTAQMSGDYVATGLPTTSAPTGVFASDGAYPDRVEVTWWPVSEASHYRVYRSTSPGGAKTPVSDWQAAATFDDTSALQGSIYYYWVRSATSDQGDRAGDYSSGDEGRLSEPL